MHTSSIEKLVVADSPREGLQLVFWLQADGGMLRVAVCTGGFWIRSSFRLWNYASNNGFPSRPLYPGQVEVKKWVTQYPPPESCGGGATRYITPGQHHNRHVSPITQSGGSQENGLHNTQPATLTL